MNITSIQTNPTHNHSTLYESISHVTKKGIDVTQKIMTVFLRIVALSLLVPILGTCNIILFTRIFCKICAQTLLKTIRFFDHLIHNHGDNTIVDKKKNLVVLTATSDWNKAFAVEKPRSQELSSVYEIQRARVTTISDIISALEKVPKEKPVDALWLNAHGLSSGMFFGVSEWEEWLQWLKEKGLQEDDQAKRDSLIETPECPVLCEKNIHLLKNLLQEKISSNGTIVLFSCNTGNEKEASCIAREISKIALGRTVYAPTMKAGVCYEITSLTPLSVNLRAKGKYIDFFHDGISDILKRVFSNTFTGNPLYAYRDECTKTFLENQPV